MNAQRPSGPSDVFVLGLLAAVAGTLALVWLWGGLAGELFGRGWPRVAGPGQLLTVLTRLPSHLRDPALAWPAGARSRLPGAVGTYAALAALLGVAGAILLVAYRGGALDIVRRRVGGSSGGSGARWASGPELRALRGRGGGRLVLGSRNGRTLCAEHRHALVAFGPPQSGKSAGLAIPALLEWQGPAIASSIKTDLLATTIARRRQLGRVFVFDPFELTGADGGQTWSPLGGAGTWDGALEVAWRLAAAGELDQKGVEGGDFWAVAAEQRLAPLLYAAAGTGAGIDRVVRWAYGQGLRELDQALAELSGSAVGEQQAADANAAYDAVRAFETQADRTRSSIEATAQGLLRAYRFARVARSATGCEITADRILDEAATLYLIGDAKASKLLRPLFLALVGEVVDRAYERANRAGGALELPLLLCLDEAGNVAPLPNLAEIASTAPSHNIQLVSIFHDLAQARSRYGRQAETVVNAHRARMLLPGVADLETLQYFSGLVGEEEVRDVTRTTGAGGASRSTARRRRPLVAAEALRRLPSGHALLLYGSLAPIELRLRMWFADRRLRRLAGARSGGAS
ncbi:MAG: type IV secretory system conjugative DNA transfer family protein [Solirubrobacteraceae bacterium]